MLLVHPGVGFRVDGRKTSRKLGGLFVTYQAIAL